MDEHGLAIGNSGMSTTDIEPQGLPELPVGLAEER